MRAARKIPSYCNKEESATIAQLNRATIAQLNPIATDAELERCWTEKPISVTSSASVSTASKAVYDAVRFFEFRSGERRVCDEPAEVIASFCNVSVRQTKYSLKELVSEGFLVKSRKTLGRYTATYQSVSMPDIHKKAKELSGVAGKCKECKVDRVVDQMGVCGSCRGDERARSEVRQAIDRLGTQSWTAIWADCKAHGAKSSRKQLYKAFIFITGRTE